MTSMWAASMCRQDTAHLPHKLVGHSLCHQAPVYRASWVSTAFCTGLPMIHVDLSWKNLCRIASGHDGALLGPDASECSKKIHQNCDKLPLQKTFAAQVPGVSFCKTSLSDECIPKICCSSLAFHSQACRKLVASSQVSTLCQWKKLQQSLRSFNPNSSGNSKSFKQWTKTKTEVKLFEQCRHLLYIYLGMVLILSSPVRSRWTPGTRAKHTAHSSPRTGGFLNWPQIHKSANQLSTNQFQSIPACLAMPCPSQESQSYPVFWKSFESKFNSVAFTS